MQTVQQNKEEAFQNGHYSILHRHLHLSNDASPINMITLCWKTSECLINYDPVFLQLCGRPDIKNLDQEMILTASCFADDVLHMSITLELKKLFSKEVFTEGDFSLVSVEPTVTPSVNNSPNNFYLRTQQMKFKLRYPSNLTEQQAVMFVVKNSRGCGLWFNWKSQSNQPMGERAEIQPIALSSLSLGVFKTSDTFLDLIAKEENIDCKAKCVLQTEKNIVEVHWSNPNGTFRLEVPIKSLGNTVTVFGDGNVVQVFLHIKHPPLVYRCDGSSQDDDNSDMIRTNCLGKNIPLDVLGDVEVVCLTCTDDKFARLKDIFQNETRRLRFTHVKTLDLDEQTEVSKMMKIQKDVCFNFKHSDFDVMYAMHSLLSRGYKSINLFCQIVKLLEGCKNFSHNDVVSNLHNVAQLLDTGVCAFFLDAHGVLQNTSQQSSQNQRQLAVRTCTLTPTRILLDNAQKVPKNLLFDRYPPEDFLRLSMIDDNNESLTYIRSVDEENIYDNWICRQICRINLSDVHYEFLGCSNSQIKQHGCYLYKQPNSHHQTASAIRSTVGDLHNIRCVAKYMARFGLALSSLTAAPRRVNSRWIKTIQDITGGQDSQGKPYVFTDGVCKISTEAMGFVSTIESPFPVCFVNY